jgi:hypothetical protein
MECLAVVMRSPATSRSVMVTAHTTSTTSSSTSTRRPLIEELSSLASTHTDNNDDDDDAAPLRVAASKRRRALIEPVESTDATTVPPGSVVLPSEIESLLAFVHRGARTAPLSETFDAVLASSEMAASTQLRICVGNAFALAAQSSSTTPAPTADVHWGDVVLFRTAATAVRGITSRDAAVLTVLPVLLQVAFSWAYTRRTAMNATVVDLMVSLSITRFVATRASRTDRECCCSLQLTSEANIKATSKQSGEAGDARNDKATLTDMPGSAAVRLNALKLLGK